MISNEPIQEVAASGGVKLVSNFSITDDTAPRIMRDFSDKMYTLKELAIVREYLTNAADAMTQAGLPISDIIVSLPTLDDMTFRVRDFGAGLAEDKIVNVYCVFGASDKRNSNAYNGMFGYGCKAGFACADSFTVTSWINGEKSIYQCVKGDATTAPYVFLISRTASDEPSGIEVAVPIAENKRYTFHSTAAVFFQYWPVLPIIKNLSEAEMNNLTTFRSTAPTLEGKGWEIRGGCRSPRGVVYMGYVSYLINWDVLYNKVSYNSKTRVLFELIKQNNVVLFFNIGEITFGTNREGLEYTDETIKSVTERVNDIFDTIHKSIQSKFDTASNLWEAKKMYNSIFGTSISCHNDSDEMENLDQIRVLDGDLRRFEETFGDTFKWNGIPLSGPAFKDIHRFDNSRTGIQSERHIPVSPVLTTYRKKKFRVKRCVCKQSGNNAIMATPVSVVLINDTNRTSGVQQVARYLIFKNSSSKIKTVYVLTFESTDIKDKFTAEYNFETVPVLKMSDLLPEVKQWASINRKSPTDTNNNSDREYGNRGVDYIDVATGKKNVYYGSIRLLKEGGLFIRVRDLEHNCSINLENQLRSICKLMDIDVEQRVYFITNQTGQSKWFADAIKDGTWVSLWDYFKDYIDDMARIVDTYNYWDESPFGFAAARYFYDKVGDKNSPLREFIELGDMSPMGESIFQLAELLVDLDIWNSFIGNEKPSVNMKEKVRKLKETYPLLNQVENYINSGGFEPNSKMKTNIINYINATDFWNEMHPVTVTATTEVQCA